MLKFNKDTRDLLDLAVNQINRSNVKIQLRTEATPGLVYEVKPEVLIVAVGSAFLVL